MRLRQIALVAQDLEEAERQVSAELGLELCHRDPGVAAFGLANALFCAGDTFVEIVSPTQEGTTAGRYLERNGGDSGYMVILQASADERAACLERAAEHNIRTVWDGSIPGIAGTHFHPKDMGGAILSVDTADPPESWAWAGDTWRDKAGAGQLGDITIALPEAECAAVAQRWSDVLGCPQVGTNTVELDGSTISFVAHDARSGLIEIDLQQDRAPTQICGVNFR